MKFLACCVLPDKKLYGNCLYWCKYARDFDGATVPDRRVWLPLHLPVLSLLCAWILIWSCWLTDIDIRLLDFYRKWGLGPDQSHYNQSQLWFRLHTTLAQITQITPSEYTLNILYWKYFHCSGFLSNLRLPWKTEFFLKFSLYWVYFLPFKIFEQLCAYNETQSLPWNFTVFNILFTFRIFEQLALALNLLYWIYFLQWRAVRFVTGEALSLSKPNLRVYELNGVA